MFRGGCRSPTASPIVVYVLAPSFVHYTVNLDPRFDPTLIKPSAHFKAVADVIRASLRSSENKAKIAQPTVSSGPMPSSGSQFSPIASSPTGRLSKPKILPVRVHCLSSSDTSPCNGPTSCLYSVERFEEAKQRTERMNGVIEGGPLGPYGILPNPR